MIYKILKFVVGISLIFCAAMIFILFTRGTKIELESVWMFLTFALGGIFLVKESW
jgi:hypothetical protein